MRLFKSLSLILAIVILPIAGCIDDSPVAYNQYGIDNVTPPIPKAAGNSYTKKVHIGHDLPVTVTITATYDETDVPLQFYLLNVDDVEEVDGGIGVVDDIRMYYCHRTTTTTIAQLQAGTHEYGIIINIPAEDAKDELTDDYKIGTYYVVCEVNKYEDAEIDAYVVYEKFKDKLDEENKVVITSDYASKPDLSVEDMNFTGGEDTPNDVVVFYNVVLNNLPGGEDLPTIYVEPSEKDRTFTGTVHVKSSASDALNVPIVFTLKCTKLNSTDTISVPLEIFDKTMGGYVEKYYIPLLKANTTEGITLGLRIPGDSGGINYFNESAYDGYVTDLINYPLSAIRHCMYKNDDTGDDAYRDYTFSIVADVNPGGSVQESRFILPKENNDVYIDTDYEILGNVTTLTRENNTKEQDLIFKLDKIEVEPNEGIKAYPYCKLDPPDEDYRSIVIFWDGLALNVGDSKFGATAEAHEGMFFHNYSLYSLGVDIHGTIFNNTMYLVNTYLNAESHPYNELTSGFELHIEGGQKVVLSEAGQGFSENNWEYPILIWGAEKSMEKWVYCFKFKLTAGVETWFTPGLNVNVNQDGSLLIEKYANLRGAVYADASASIAGLATVGLYTYLNVITLELIQSCYTLVQYDEVNFPGRVKGTLNREVGIYLTGPKGYINLYFEIDFIFFSKRWEKEIYSFSTFRIPLLEMDFSGSGEYTNWIRVEDASLIDYSTPDKNSGMLMSKPVSSYKAYKNSLLNPYNLLNPVK